MVTETFRNDRCGGYGLTLPIALYDNPGIHLQKGTSIDAEVVGKLWKSGMVAAIKGSSGKFDVIEDYIKTGIRVYAGNEDFIAEAIEAGIFTSDEAAEVRATAALNAAGSG